VARLVRSSLAGVIGPDEVLATSPFPADVTRVALERGRLELGGHQAADL
jgi:hypothetical protein